MATVTPDNFGKAVGEVLQTFSHSVETSVDTAAMETGKKTAQLLKKTSPVKARGVNSGRYAKGWAVKKTKKAEIYVYNKTDYNLTHLLEYGHRIVSHRKDTGKKTRANPHIASAEQFAQKEFVDSVTLKIQH